MSALRKRNTDQIIEALGNENKWYAGEHYQRSPSALEALMYYILHGDAENHAQRCNNMQPKTTNVICNI